jgi:hypothetical protein
MLTFIPPEITIASFSIIGVLGTYVWNDQSTRIKKLESDVDKCPMPDIRVDIATIKNDVFWIKKRLK